MSNNKKIYISPIIKIDAFVLEDVLLVSNAYDQGMDDFFDLNSYKNLGGKN